jgi:hypothetical protein
MKKIIKEKPIFETIQTGTVSEEKWITSDGTEFEHESSAERHEFYNCKLEQRGFGVEELDRATILNLSSLEDLLRYEEDNLYDAETKYNKSELQFPDTYVIYEVDEADYSEDYSYSYPEWKAYILPINEFKSLVVKRIMEQK